MDIFSQNFDFFSRLVLAVLLGALIGLERQIARKTAGLRTFSLVSLGSCLLSVISISLFKENYPDFSIIFLPTAIIGGIGFIGAGLIIFHGSHPSGITTAAGLLVSAAVGIATGFGFYGIAAFTTILTILIFTIFWIFETKVLSKFIDSQSSDENNL